MKNKRLFIAAAVAVTALFGCSGVQSPKNAVTDFSSRAVVTRSGEETEYSLNSNLSGIVLTAKSGDMSGIKYRCSGGTVEAEFSDIGVSYDKSAFKNSDVYTLYCALSTIRNGENITLSENNGGISIYKGESDAGDFTAEVETDTGYISRIVYNGIDFSAELSNVSEYK